MRYQDTRKVQAVEISCRIIAVLQRRNGAGVTELANELGHSKSTIHNHLATLTEQEFVVKNRDQYRLSLRYLDMAEHVKAQIGNYSIIKSELDTLAENTQEVAQFGIEEHGRVIYLYKKKSAQGVETASRVGKTQDIHSTGLGKAILSSLPDERVEEIIEKRGLESKTQKTITSREGLFEELQQIRERGYVIDDEENVEGIRCIAAPVTWHSVHGAVSITGPASRFQGDRLVEDLPNQIRHAANVIEVNSRFQ